MFSIGQDLLFLRAGYVEFVADQHVNAFLFILTYFISLKRRVKNASMYDKVPKVLRKASVYKRSTQYFHSCFDPSIYIFELRRLREHYLHNCRLNFATFFQHEYRRAFGMELSFIHLIDDLRTRQRKYYLVDLACSLRTIRYHQP